MGRKDMTGDRENQRGVDAMHGPHNERYNARGFIQRRDDQPIEQQICNRIEKALLLSWTDIVKIAVVQVRPRGVEMIIAEIPVIIGPQDDGQESRADTDKQSLKLN